MTRDGFGRLLTSTDSRTGKRGQSLDLNILIDVTGLVGWHAAWSDYEVHGQASGVD